MQHQEHETTREVYALGSYAVQSDTKREAATSTTDDEQRRISRIGTLLRYIGVGILVVGIGCFMFQRWGISDHLERYFLFLGFTASVCGAGLWCGLKIDENKGARTLLGAVVALIPVHCSQLGAMLFSQVASCDDRFCNGAYIPVYLRWNPGSWGTTLFTVAVGLGVLAPMAYLSYSVLARRYALPLCAIGFGISSLLMIPSRDPMVVGIILVGGALVTILSERRFSLIAELSTREAVLARAVPFGALCMLVGRQCYIYGASSFLLGILAAIGSVGFLGAAATAAPRRWLMKPLEALSLGCTILAGVYCADGIVDAVGLQRTIAYPLTMGLLTAFSLSAVGLRAQAIPATFQYAAASTILLTGVGELLETSLYNPAASLVALGFGILAFWWGSLIEKRSILMSGLVLTALALLETIKVSLTYLPVGWLTLGILGVVTIVAASYFERNFGRLKARMSVWRNEVMQWE